MTNKYFDRTREDITGEHKAGDAGQIIFALLFFAAWIADSFFFQITTFLNEYLAVPRTVLGVIILIAAAYLSFKGLSIVFGEERENPAVIRKGVFLINRHPIYFGEILLYLGLLCLSISLIAAFIWILSIIFLYNISRYEEKLLLHRFGKDYQNYMNEVPMWIPRLPIPKKK